MPELITEAIVLRRTDYRDADRIIALFSPDHGRLDVMARGVRKPSARLKAACEPFATGTFHIQTAGGRAALIGFTLSEGFFPLRRSYERLTQASYALGACLSAAQPGKPSPELFSLLQLTLARLAYTEQPGENLLVRFLLSFAAYEGLAPSLDACAICGKAVNAGPIRFSSDEGGVCHASCAPFGVPLSAGALEYLRGARHGLDAEADDDAPNTADGLRVMRGFIEANLGGRIKAGELL
ncbi:MAG: DNA repair protein RecO [Oscillospiraceae bacterium]|jgi:DNA repair protein RecO (recombination protein O)|nr:DNA repair protein RecO [Oscillospiraceae bacterium]